MGKKNFYAVASGRTPGLYSSWAECQAQVDNFKGCVFKGFSSETEAREYLDAHPTGPPAPTAHGRLHSEGSKASVTHQRGGYSRPPAFSRRPAPTYTPAATRKVRVEFDGASKSNPGPSGCGAALYDSSTGAMVGQVSRFMGTNLTNNQAEYGGLIAGLQEAKARGYDRVEVQGDSKLVVNQVLGAWAVRNEGLQPYHAEATALKGHFKEFVARQVPREHNKVADALSNDAVNAWRKGTAGEAWKLPSGKKRGAKETNIAPRKKR